MLDFLNQLVQLAKQAAPMVFGLGTQQVVAWALQSLVWVITLAVTEIILIKGLRATWRHSQGPSSGNTEESAVGIFTAICLLGAAVAIVGVFLVVNLNYFVGYVVSPGYYAVQALKDLLR